MSLTLNFEPDLNRQQNKTGIVFKSKKRTIFFCLFRIFITKYFYAISPAQRCVYEMQFTTFKSLVKWKMRLVRTMVIALETTRRVVWFKWTSKRWWSNEWDAYQRFYCNFFLESDAYMWEWIVPRYNLSCNTLSTATVPHIPRLSINIFQKKTSPFWFDFIKSESFFSVSAILQRATVDVGKIRIQGVATCLFLCMDACGNVYGTVCMNSFFLLNWLKEVK